MNQPAVLLIAGCRWGAARPGKPTATPSPEPPLAQVRIAGDAYPDYWCMTMILPLQITFRHVDPSPAHEARIRQLASAPAHAADLLHDERTSTSVGA